jgi:hypothetical protein
MIRHHGILVGLMVFPWAAGLLTAGAAELTYMPVFTAGEYAAAHVRAASHRMPQDFVDGQWQCRGLICDTNGALYGSEHDGVIYCYNPRDGKISRLATRLPSDPKVEQPTGPNGIPKGAHWSAWHTTRWEQMVWSIQGQDPAKPWANRAQYRPAAA